MKMYLDTLNTEDICLEMTKEESEGTFQDSTVELVFGLAALAADYMMQKKPIVREQNYNEVAEAIAGLFSSMLKDMISEGILD